VNLSVSFDPGLQQRNLLSRASSLLQRGEGERAREFLLSVRAAHVHSAQEAIAAAGMLLDVHQPEAALALVERARALDSRHPEAAELLAECRYLIDLPLTWQAEGGAIRAALERLNARAVTPQPAARHVHVVCNLDSIGGSERRALNLYRRLRPHVPVTLWSTAPPHAAHLREAPIRLIEGADAPADRTLALIGTYYDCAGWLERGRFERIVVCHNLMEQNQSLLRRLRQIEDNPARPPVELTFPSRMFRDLLGLPGNAEYSAVDLARFRRTPRPAAANANLVIGRHGRAYAWKFHYNDPALFRQLCARGYRVKLLGGDVIAPAFAQDAGARPELIAEGAVDAAEFLDGLDVFLYRKHPQWLETGGAVILEAMAMTLPVVVFAEHCGCTELIAHGENGFLVASEAEALETIERLRADPGLRERVGAAARQTLIDLQQREEPEVLARYAR
jgi:glycosyltransferase involved in cell wall biosynthesis